MMDNPKCNHCGFICGTNPDCQTDAVVARLTEEVERLKQERDALADKTYDYATLESHLHFLKLENRRLKRERDEALDILRIIDRHDDIEFGLGVEGELIHRLNIALAGLYKGDPSIGDRLTAAEQENSRLAALLEEARALIPDFSTEHPRERSFAGLSSPCRIGPIAVAPPIRWAIL